MKIIILAALFALTLSLTTTGAAFTATYTNSTTKTLSTCSYTAVVTISATLTTTAASYDIWSVWQASSTAPAAKDMGIWCAGLSGTTTPFSAASATCTTFTLSAGSVTSLTGTAGTSLTTTVVATTVVTSQSFMFTLPVGTFDAAWNTTLSKSSTYAQYVGAQSGTAETFPTAAEGVTVSTGSWAGTACWTGYSSFWVASDSQSFASIITGMLSFAFF
jgi:hypothetical protein